MNAKFGKTLSIFLTLTLMLALTFGPLGASPARAAGISVNSTAQEVPFVVNGNCTLGEAIFAANVDAAVDGCAAGSGSDEIFVPAGVYLLTAVYAIHPGETIWACPKSLRPSPLRARSPAQPSSCAPPPLPRFAF